MFLHGPGSLYGSYYLLLFVDPKELGKQLEKYKNQVDSLEQKIDTDEKKLNYVLEECTKAKKQNTLLEREIEDLKSILNDNI